MSRKKIIVDMDDVLSASAEGFIKHSNQRWGHKLSAQDYQEAWADMWSISLEEAVARAAVLHKEHDFMKEYARIDHAYPVLKRLAEAYDLIVLTSRRMVLKEITEAWINLHYPSIFSDIVYAGIWDRTDNHVLERLNQTKAELCSSLGGDYLIDDQLKHCYGAAELDVPSFLFGDYRWNQTTERLPDIIVRVSNWKQIEEHLNAAS